MSALSLKCLSAFGFWGTQIFGGRPSVWRGVSNAFRLLGSGERLAGAASHPDTPRGLKCLSAFGFWGTHTHKTSPPQPPPSQMPFGFWVLGNAVSDIVRDAIELQSLKCLSAFGFWGTTTYTRVTSVRLLVSQMPFGFWVLGNHSPPPPQQIFGGRRLKCLSAFGFWGTVWICPADLLPTLSQMPFGFWVLGNK